MDQSEALSEALEAPKRRKRRRREKLRGAWLDHSITSHHLVDVVCPVLPRMLQMEQGFCKIK